MSDWIKQQTIDVLRQSIADAPKQSNSGAGFLNLDTRIVSELCDTWESEATLRAENELMREVVSDLLPRGVCWDNPNIPDNTVIPVDMTMGEIRKARNALAQVGQ